MVSLATNILEKILFEDVKHSILERNFSHIKEVKITKISQKNKKKSLLLMVFLLEIFIISVKLHDDKINNE